MLNRIGGVMVVIVVTIVLLEIAARVIGAVSPYERHPEIGWRTKASFSADYKQMDSEQNAYTAEFATEANGLRFHGDPKATRRILVLGDSFTSDPYVSNDAVWYAVATDV